MPVSGLGGGNPTGGGGAGAAALAGAAEGLVLEEAAIAGAAAAAEAPVVVVAGAVVATGVVVYVVAKNSGTDQKDATEEKPAEAERPPQPTNPGRMQKEVERGQAPRDVERVDKPHVPNQEPHVHYKDGTSSNRSGTTHDAHRGDPNPSREAREWLEQHGWTPPPKAKCCDFTVTWPMQRLISHPPWVRLRSWRRQKLYEE